MEAKYSLVLAFLMIGLVTAEYDEEVEDFDQRKEDDELLITVPLDYNSPILHQNKMTLEAKCYENGGQEAFSHAEDGFNKFKTCIQQYLNVTELQKQIDAAKPTGQVDEVFKTYCLLSPQFQSCFKNMTEDVKECLTGKEKENLKILYNVIDKLMEFACHNDGERLALIAAEGGVKCFTSKKDELVNCTAKDVNEHYVNHLEFGKEECSRMLKLQPCVVSVLETCEKPTIANVVDAMMSYTFKSTPCKEYSESLRSQTDGGNGIAVPTATTLVTLLATILV